jgi:hypothetical protein
MKYKVGDEVLVDGKIIDILELDNDADLVTIKLKSGRKIFYVNIDDLTSVKTNNSQGMTAEEVWKIAKKIVLVPEDGGISCPDLDKIFGTDLAEEIFTENTPQEAKEKIEAWKENKKFHVGDVVEKINETDRRRGVVFKVCKKAVLVLHSDFSNRWFEKEEIRKTGETIDIEAFQKQIRGE